MRIVALVKLKEGVNIIVMSYIDTNSAKSFYVTDI